jgi:hypothetical protein
MYTIIKKRKERKKDMANKYEGKTRKTTAEAEAKRMVARYTAVVKKVATMKK